jgi:hypothetical protein
MYCSAISIYIMLKFINFTLEILKADFKNPDYE